MPNIGPHARHGPARREPVLLSPGCESDNSAPNERSQVNRARQQDLDLSPKHLRHIELDESRKRKRLTDITTTDSQTKNQQRTHTLHRGCAGQAVRASAERFCPRAALSGLTHAVLSIGKLSAGQARYYLEQGEVRVDAVESIGDGLEEYYAGGAEARGTWIGSGGVSLGLSGTGRRRRAASGARGP